MKNRIIAFILLLSMLLAIASSLRLNAAAASTLTITAPSNDEHVSKSDPPKLKWSKVSGAAGYRVTVVNVDSGQDLVRNKWTTNRSYSLSSLFDDTIGNNEFPLLKIWVGAMASKDDDPGLTSLSSDIIYIKACEAPEINVSSASVITAYGANFSVSVERNFGSAVIDAGFYIGTSSDINDAKRYSAKKYAEQGVVSSGNMTLKINVLEPDTKYYFWGYAENGVDETLSSRKSFTTKAAEGSLSVSTTSVNWDDSADNSKTVTVTYTGSYSYDVDYEVASSVESGGYDYEWLSVTKSGSNLILKPNRANYSASDRIAYVTVTSDGKSKEIVVTQSKCSETAPELQLWRENQSNILNDGQNFGTFDLPQDVIEVDIISKNIRKVYAQLLASDGSLIGESTNLNKISFNTSSLTAGTYSIKVFASNSATSNDYWSQRPFESMTVYFGLKKAGTVHPNIGNKDFTSYEEAENMISYSKALDWSAVGTIQYVEQYWASGNSSDYYVGTDGYWVNNEQASGKCTRAAAAMALSYMGVTALPKNFNPTNCPYDDYASSLGIDTVGDDAESCLNNYSIDMATFNEWYEKYANDTIGKYSPIVLHTYTVEGIHAFAVIGRDPYSDNTYYIVDSGHGERLAKIELTEISGKIAIDHYIIKSTGNNSVNYNSSCAMVGVWQYINNNLSDTHTHSYTTKNYAEHPHKEYQICDCGDIIETGNTVKVTGCTECYPVPDTCPHLWATSYDKDDANHWIVCTLCLELKLKVPHTWDNGTVTKPATETSTGIKTYACTACGYTKEENIPVTEHTHTWSDVYSVNETHHWYVCTGCEEKNDIVSHLWKDGIVTKPATRTETGIMSYSCVFCDYVKEEVIPKSQLTLADVNYDGELDEKDANDLLKRLTLHEVDVDEEASDVNGDGEINIRDVANLLLYLDGKIDSLE